MKCFRKFLFLLPLVMLGSCTPEEEKSNPNSNPLYINEDVYSYSDVKGKEILYSNIFGIELDSYYVYFFSKTCSHCDNLKPFMVPKIQDRKDIFIVEASEQVVFLEDVSVTIGVSSIENFGILGYPSLVKIEEKVVTKNIAGINPIKNELTN